MPAGRSSQKLPALVKIAFDRTVSLIALIILSPVIFVTALAVALSMGFPLLFRQRRPGFRGRPFTLYKFRTMTDSRDESGHLLPDQVRLTRVGKLLRSLSLDELPQLWNVLCGDISLVGPRPLLMEYLDRYTPEQARRHDVLPGITGWAQVNGRNDLTWEEKFTLDVWYVDHYTFWLDIKILMLTVLTVFRRDGISQTGHATAGAFLGNSGPQDPAKVN